MRTTIKQISAFYLATVSGFAVGIALSHHPLLANRAGDAAQFLRTGGEQAATAIDRSVVHPAIAFASRETADIDHDIAVPYSLRAPTAELEIAPFSPRGERPAAHVAYVTAQPNSPTVRVSHHAHHDMRVGDAGMRAAHRHATPHATESVDVALDAIRSATPAAVNPRDEAATAATQVAPVRELAARVAQPPLELAPGAATASLPPEAASQSLVSIPMGPPPSTDQIAVVEQRLKDNLTPEMYDAFELFLYVSKAAAGPVAQHMYVFEKQPSGDLTLAYNWPVSTGREKVEFNPAGRKLGSFTPTGYFELDPHRFYESYWSHQWNEPMPYSMFFNWIRSRQKTGLAIHSASGDDVALLGKRASAGCIRLPPDAARTLFELIRTNYRGLAPRFAINHRTGTMSRDGIVLHDPDGRVRMAEGYKVLVFIEDYGGENVVAAVY